MTRHGGALPAAGGGRHAGIAHSGARHPGTAVPGRAQQPHVRLHSLRDELRGRRARLRRAAEGAGHFPFANGSPRTAGRAVHAVQGRSDRGIALDHFRMDAPRDLRDHGSRASSRPRGQARNRNGCGSSSTSWMRSGQIDGLKDALARLRKFGGRCVLGFQSIAQVSSTYGHGDAHTIVENCGNTLILALFRQRGRRHGTVRLSADRRARGVADHGVEEPPADGARWVRSSHSEHFNVEPAVLPSQIEQLPDLTGI